MSTPYVTAIYVTYNSEDVIRETLEGVRGAYEAGELSCIVVDNASTDATAGIVRNEYPWVTLIQSAENLGYGRGLNLGSERVDTPYVLYMNPDAVIELPSIRRLHTFMEDHPSAAIGAPAIIKPDEDYQHAGGLLTPYLLVKRAVVGTEKLVAPIVPNTAPFQTDWLSGAILFGRTSVMRSLGGFDPRFFLYYEETDLCKRVLDRSWELWAVGEAVAHHVGGASSKQKAPELEAGGCIPSHFYQSRYYYLTKHYGWKGTGAQLVELAILGAKDAARFILRRPSKHELRRRLRAPIFQYPPLELAYSPHRSASNCE